MRRRTIAALITLIIVAGVVAYAALTADPPEPYARIYDTRVASYHLEQIECVDGKQALHYVRDDGRPMAAVLTDDPCSPTPEQ